MEGREDVGLVLAPLQLVLLRTHPLERRTTARKGSNIHLGVVICHADMSKKAQGRLRELAAAARGRDHAT